MADRLSDVERLLARRIGLDPLAVGRGMIARAVHREMSARGIADLEDYYTLLVNSETELASLIDEVIVPESWFFRDDRPFRWLEDLVRERWLTDSSRPPLRVLSLACSSGEEPYSIAMTLLDVGLAARRFRIDAIDISSRRLDIARRAVYGPNSFRGLNPAQPDRSEPVVADSAAGLVSKYATSLTPGVPSGWIKHFREHPSGLELDPKVRATVHFSRASLLDPELLAKEPAYDIIFCRNVLIYFDPQARDQVLLSIERLLAAGGYLVIGHADRLGSYDAEPRFSPEGDSACFVYRRAASAAAVSRSDEASRAAHSRRSSGTGPNSTANRRKISEHAQNQTRQSDPGRPAGANAPSLHQAVPGEPPATLERASELANQGLFAEAIEQCRRHLREKGPSAPAYYLMGMIFQATADRAQAEDCFQKTAYLDPTHSDALLALALLAERRGDRMAAAAYHRRADRAANRTAPRKGELT